MLDFYKNKTVLVTGDTGFKGTWLCNILNIMGAKVIGYAIAPPTSPSMFDTLDMSNKITHIQADIRDLNKLKEVFNKYKPEIVLHLAAQPLVRTSYDEPVYTYETNVIGTVNVLECVRLTDSVKVLLNVTTDKVYNNEDLEKSYIESDVLDGYDPYSNSKSCSELVTHSYYRSFFSSKDIAIITARAGNVIGGGDFALDRIVPDCVRAGLTKNTMHIRNPYSIRPYQYVLEPLFVYLMLCMKNYNKNVYATYNVGPNEDDCISTGALVDIFKNKWQDDFIYEINKEENAVHEASFLKLDCDLIKKTYNWKPIYDIDMAIAKTVEWFKSYELGDDMQSITDKQIKEFWDRFVEFI